MITALVLISHIGEFKEGKLHGKGIHNYISGAKYDGDWLNNLRDGFGIYYYPEGGIIFVCVWCALTCHLNISYS